jgi:hypothetical protein
VETLVNEIVARTPGLKHGATSFRQVDPDDNGMLKWASGSRKYADFQNLELYGLGRLGTVGDGNCLIHSFLTALSPTYRAHDGKSRSAIADRFRKVLQARADELRDLADVTFAEVGGAAVLEESFGILMEYREEINIELAPLIGYLYGVNLLAVQINDDMTLRPVCATWKGFDPSRPTILVNYLGGGLDFGNVGFMEGGHYEAIIAPTVVVAAAAAAPEANAAAAAGAGAGARARRSTRKASAKKKEDPIVSLNEVATQYVFMPGAAELAPVLAMFAAGCVEEMSPEAAALAAQIAAREATAANMVHRALSRYVQRHRTRKVAKRSSSSKNKK